MLKKKKISVVLEKENDYLIGHIAGLAFKEKKWLKDK